MTFDAEGNIIGMGDLSQYILDKRVPLEICLLSNVHTGVVKPIEEHPLQMIEKEIPEIVVILGPNHYGIGGRVSLMSEGFWETPLGRVEIDKEIARFEVQVY